MKLQNKSFVIPVTMDSGLVWFNGRCEDRDMIHESFPILFGHLQGSPYLIFISRLGNGQIGTRNMLFKVGWLLTEVRNARGIIWLSHTPLVDLWSATYATLRGAIRFDAQDNHVIDQRFMCNNLDNEFCKLAKRVYNRKKHIVG